MDLADDELQHWNRVRRTSEVHQRRAKRVPSFGESRNLVGFVCSFARKNFDCAAEMRLGSVVQLGLAEEVSHQQVSFGIVGIEVERALERHQRRLPIVLVPVEAHGQFVLPLGSLPVLVAHARAPAEDQKEERQPRSHSPRSRNLYPHRIGSGLISSGQAEKALSNRSTGYFTACRWVNEKFDNGAEIARFRGS
jgi:hypothetical protein